MYVIFGNICRKFIGEDDHYSTADERQAKRFSSVSEAATWLSGHSAMGPVTIYRLVPSHVDLEEVK